MIPDDERAARAALTRIAEPGDAELGQLAGLHGAVEAVARIRSGEIRSGSADHWRVRLTGYDPHRDLAAAAAVGARLVCPGDEEWPAPLDDLDGVRLPEIRGGLPFGLWVRGPLELTAACARSVAIVGCRAATEYGENVAADIAHGVAQAGLTVTSGAAYGIDAAAHRGALVADAPTVAVLACGVDVSYPRGHVALLERIAAEGLVVSEVPPGCAPTKLRFLTRNRIIAALSQGTVVVEAGLRSGARNTARWALELMRVVMGVPGPVTSADSAGVHELLRQPEPILVTDPGEVLEAVSAIGENLAPLKFGAVDHRDQLGEVTGRVLDAVPAVRAVSVGRIATTAGLCTDVTGGHLASLLLQDFVEQHDGGWRLSASQRRARRTCTAS
ncbi:MAG TPA: DNA-processing protein DprA [Nocardioidaceae bacterium]|jgi:DNA processing protein|nr:DNA-processing protein DprA [Nocardioidaceae bacterium]